MTFKGIELFLQDKLSEAEKVRQAMLRELKLAPDGLLATGISDGHIRYFAKTEREKRYLGKEQANEIRELEKKTYYLKLLEVTEKEIKSIKRIAGIIKKTPLWEQVFAEIPEGKKHLIQPYTYGVNKRTTDGWENRRKVTASVADNINYQTRSGIRVRSKSELIIAERLEANNIPYRYEYVLFIDGAPWFPDFLVLNRRTGKEYFWEHFGMMDNPEYCASVQYKLERYADNDIVQGLNLIVTSECSKHPLNTKYIDTMIERFLL